MLYYAVGLINVNQVPTGNFDRAGNAPIILFPDPNLFYAPATAANVSEWEALEAIYNGFLKANSDIEEVIYRLELNRFRKVPRTQWGATTRPSYTGEQYEPVPMPIIFQGNKINDFTLTFSPGADTFQINGDPTVTPPTSINKLVVLHRGLVVRNLTEASTITQLRQAGIVM
jgi:hypothetical protein